MKYELKNKTIELTDEEVQEISKQAQEVKEEKTVGLEIKNRFTGEVIYTSTKTTYKDAVEEAVGYGANLREANLYGANLYGANLREAYLRGADLSEAYLREADLREADLRGADLSELELQEAKFYGKGGRTKISKSQIDDFFRALGVVVID